MMQTSPCLSDADLRSWSLGHLDDETSQQVATHLAECPQCEESAAAFDHASDSLLQGLRNAADEQSLSCDDRDLSQADRESLQQVRNPWIADDAQQSALSSPREFLRDYELLEPLGSGGMGTVYKALHTRLQRTVALKLLPSRRLRDRATVSRFEREMQAIGRLNHRTIVRATDAGEIDGTHFLAMDFVDGIDLSRLVRAVGPLSVANACEVIRQAAIGLQHAHEQGLIHRDIKPSNLMIQCPEDGLHADQNGRLPQTGNEVRILDLGLALFGSASEAVDELTTVGQLMGTLDYMAPEQADNSHEVDARADVYSLGATLFKLLAGTAPYETRELRSPLKKMKAIATVDPPPIQSRVPSLPAELAEVVDRMLLRNPDDRFGSAHDVAVAMEPWCDGQNLNHVARIARAAAVNNTSTSESDILPAVGPGTQHTDSHVASMVPSSHSGQSHSDAAPLSSPRPSGGGTLKWTLGLICSAAAICACGLLIWLKTGSGILKIESDLPDVELEIRSGSAVVDGLAVSTNGAVVSLKAGEYEVVVKEPHDALTIEGDVFTMTRGKQHVVRVTRSQNPPIERTDTREAVVDTDTTMPRERSTMPQVHPDSLPRFANPVDAVEYAQLTQRYALLLNQEAELEAELSNAQRRMSVDHPEVRSLQEQFTSNHKRLQECRSLLNLLLERKADLSETDIRQGQHAALEPVYEEKTFFEWKQITETERSPAHLTKAIDALFRLAQGDATRQASAARTMLATIRHFPCVFGSQSAEAELVTSAIRSLRRMPSEAVEPAMIAELALGKGFGVDHVLDGILSKSRHRAVRSRLNDTVGSLDLGNAERLRQHARQSVPLLRTLVTNFDRLTLDQKRHAVLLIPELGTVPELNVELQQIMNDLLSSPDADLRCFAANRLAPHHPSAALVPPLLAEIERTEPANINPEALRSWQTLYGLREFLASDIERLVGLPRGERRISRMPTFGRQSGSGGSPGRTMTRTTYDDEGTWMMPEFAEAAQPADLVWQAISRRLLQVELVAAVGNKADQTAPVLLEFLSAEFRRLTGQAPIDGGDIVHAADRSDLLIARRYNLQGAYAKQQQSTRLRAAEDRTSSKRELVTSLLIAWELITGDAPCFEEPLSVTLWDARVRWSPRVASFRGGSLDDWLEVDVTTTTPITELHDIVEAVEELAIDDGKKQRGMPVMLQTLQEMIIRTVDVDYVPGRLPDEHTNFPGTEAGKPIWRALRWCHDTDAAATVAFVIQLLEQSDMSQQEFILREIVAPAAPAGTASDSIYPITTDFAAHLRSGEGAARRYQQFAENWRKLTPGLQDALLHVEFATLTVGDSASLGLLQQVLSSADSRCDTAAANALARKTDLPRALVGTVTARLLSEIADPGDNASLVNSVASLAVLWPDELTGEHTRRILDMLLQDAELAEVPAHMLRVKQRSKREIMKILTSRRLLLAELLQIRPVSDSDLRKQIVDQLSQLSGGSEPTAYETAPGWAQQSLESLLPTEYPRGDQAMIVFGSGDRMSGQSEQQFFRTAIERTIRALR